ncbi:Cytoplasmic glyoxalase II [Onygenales sp. PD_40]|nr:Cytoplasmic glyoxalase II [Onygenales sp. PD_40]
MHIESIPMWTGSGNNYAYLISDEPSKDAMIVDPAHPPEVIPVLKSHIEAGKINLKAIINTHHHYDHAGGNEGIVSYDLSLIKALLEDDDPFPLKKKPPAYIPLPQLKQFGNKLPIIGGKDCTSVTKTPKHGETFKIGERIKVTALHTPCHTQDSICYYAEDGDQRVVFTGDTLFIGGCGRFFEGTAQQMHKALNEVLASLPDDTKVYPGHEYTLQNVKFCLSVSQQEPIKQLQAFAEKNQQTQGKFTIGDEKLHNVFMRVNDPEIQAATQKTDPIDVMRALREMKNNM